MTVDINETGSAHPWRLRIALLGAALVVAAMVRAQIAGSEFRVEEAPQRIQLTEELPPPPEDEVQLVEEEPEELVEMQAPDESDFEDDAVPAVDDLLGLDAQAVAGADAFGLMARKGGTDLLLSGNGGCDWYQTVLNDELNSMLVPILSDRDALVEQAWSVVVTLWLEPDGHVEDWEITSTGDTEIDAELRAALHELDRVGTPPPADLPQPVRLRVRCQA